MRNYELALIADPELDEKALADLSDKIQSWVEAAGGRIVKVDDWGRRRLAYPIRRHNDGYYRFIQAELPASGSGQVEREMRLSEQIMRFMITLQEPA
jgi:small subunit ribosomal protein S6